MVYNPDIHHRRSIRLKEWDYSQSGAYYITICIHDRECLLGYIKDGEVCLSEYGQVVQNEWNKLTERYPNIRLDEYVIMPNHVHGIIIVNNNEDVGAIHELPLQNPKQRRQMLIPKIIGYFKMNTSKQINQMMELSHGTIWQRNYYEHIIRDEVELNRKRNYIQNNPTNWEADENFA